MLYSFCHTPRIRSIRNGGYQKHNISLAEAHDEFAQWLAADTEGGTFVAEEIPNEKLPKAYMRFARIRHARSRKVWYTLQITK